MERIKAEPDLENEIHDLAAFRDEGVNVVSPIAYFPEDVARGVVRTLAGVVRRAHASPVASRPDENGIVRAQMFEEGAVHMVASPFDGFSADRYLMDFYDVRERKICSRLHLHIGMRFVRMMTGPGTTIRVTGLSPFEVNEHAPAADMNLAWFEDSVALSDDQPETTVRTYNFVVPPCAWVDMQIPRATSHQFNAIGPDAVIDTVHPEESIELFRERTSRVNMMAQTVFLQDEALGAESCSLPTSLEPLPDATVTSAVFEPER